MNDRTTHSVAINVLEAFEPKLPDHYLDSAVVVLGNMSPKNQLDVIGQAAEDAYIIADTMDIWIPGGARGVARGAHQDRSARPQ